MRGTWRFIVCWISDSRVSQTRPATSQRSGMCYSWALCRRWFRRSSDKVTRTCGPAFTPIRWVRLVWRRRHTVSWWAWFIPCSSSDGTSRKRAGNRLNSRFRRFGTIWSGRHRPWRNPTIGRIALAGSRRTRLFGFGLWSVGFGV